MSDEITRPDEPTKAVQQKPRSSAVVVSGRVLEIYRLRLRGKEFPDLWDFAAKQGWGVSRTTLTRYIAAADEMCEKHYNRRAIYMHARHIMQRRMLLDKCLDAGDFRTALSVLQDEAKLANLYPANKVEAVYRNLRSLEQMSDEELARIAAAGVEDADSGAGGGSAGDSGEAKSPDESA